MSSVEQCVLCKSRAMTFAGNSQNANQMKHQIRTIFVLRKLLEIQSSTCSDLLVKVGNPSVWVSYCVECFETVIEAERIFSKLVKFESKWKNLKQIVENKIFEHQNQKRAQKTSAKIANTDSDIVDRLWEETAQRLGRVSRNINSLTDSKNAENVIKVEIDYSYDNYSVIDDNYNDKCDSADESEDSSPKEDCRDDSNVDLVKPPEKSLGCSNEMNNFGRRTRSGHLIKTKKNSDADDSDFRLDELDEQSNNSEDEIINHNDPNSNLQCQQCNRAFKSKEGLNYHRRRCHDTERKVPKIQGEFSCEECSSFFSTKAKLENHVHNKHKGYKFWFPCTLCKIKFITSGLLDIHVKSTHDKPKELSGSRLQDHFKCKECPRQFPSFAGLTRHQVRNHVSGKEKPYPCDKCPKGFFFSRTLRGHIMKEHSEEPAEKKQIACSKGELQFDTETDLETNILSAHSENEDTDKSAQFWFKCHLCQKKFVTAQLLEIHTQSVHDKPEKLDGKSTLQENFKCKICDRIFPSFNGLTRHQVRTHGTQKPFRCLKCPKGFFEYKGFRNHCIKDHNEEPAKVEKMVPAKAKTSNSNILSTRSINEDADKSAEFWFKCDLCNKKFTTAQMLEIHTQSVHNKPEELDGNSTLQENFKCKICDRTFPSFSGLNKHQIRTHVSGKQKPFRCSECSKGFFCNKGFRLHRIKEHNWQPAKKTKTKKGREEYGSQYREKPFACSQCKLRFMAEVGLEKHILKEHDENFTVQCSGCPKRFKHSFLMKHHFKIVHRKEKNFICEICSKSFSSKWQMKCHQMSEHERSEELKCKECGHIASVPSALKRHVMSVHDKDKCAFKCPVCDYRTHCNSALKYHIIARHTNKKRHSCTMCDKSYAHSSSLTEHMRTHTGERPYKCQFCEKTFINNKRRNRHQEDLHSTGKHYQCEICGKRFPSKHYLETHVYDTHRKRQKDPVPEKIMINDELLKEVINQDSKK